LSESPCSTKAMGKRGAIKNAPETQPNVASMTASENTVSVSSDVLHKWNRGASRLLTLRDTVPVTCSGELTSGQYLSNI
jgi:hypothetical protein